MVFFFFICRQSSYSSVGYHQLRSTQLAVSDMIREICIGQPVARHSPLSTPRFTTTFPVSGSASAEKRYIFFQQNVLFQNPLDIPYFIHYDCFAFQGFFSILEIIFSKPLLSADVHRYQQLSPLQQRNSPEQSVTSPRNVAQSTGSSSNLRPPPPAYPVAVRNGLFGLRSPLGKVITTPTDLRMDNLKNYYKDKTNERKKNATAV